MLQQDEEALDVEGAGGGGGGGKKKPPPPQLPPINPLRVRAFFVAAVLTVFTSSLVPSITSRASIWPFQIAINYAGVWVDEDMPTPISLLPCGRDRLVVHLCRSNWCEVREEIAGIEGSAGAD